MIPKITNIHEFEHFLDNIESVVYEGDLVKFETEFKEEIIELIKTLGGGVSITKLSTETSYNAKDLKKGIYYFDYGYNTENIVIDFENSDGTITKLNWLFNIPNYSNQPIMFIILKDIDEITNVNENYIISLTPVPNIEYTEKIDSVKYSSLFDIKKGMVNLQNGKYSVLISDTHYNFRGDKLITNDSFITLFNTELQNNIQSGLLATESYVNEQIANIPSGGGGSQTIKEVANIYYNQDTFPSVETSISLSPVIDSTNHNTEYVYDTGQLTKSGVYLLVVDFMGLVEGLQGTLSLNLLNEVFHITPIIPTKQDSVLNSLSVQKIIVNQSSNRDFELSLTIDSAHENINIPQIYTHLYYLGEYEYDVSTGGVG